MDQDYLKSQIVEMVYEYSFSRQKVVLTSGKESDYYIDCKQVMLKGKELFCIACYILQFIRQKYAQVKAVGGMALGAVPLAAAVSVLSYESHPFPLASFFVRPEAKGHGTKARVEHPGLPAGTPVLVVEDVITTGGSSLKAINAAREQGWQVAGVLALVDRQEGGREAITRAGCVIDAIMTRDDLFALEKIKRTS